MEFDVFGHLVGGQVLFAKFDHLFLSGCLTTLQHDEGFDALALITDQHTNSLRLPKPWGARRARSSISRGSTYCNHLPPGSCPFSGRRSGNSHPLSSLRYPRCAARRCRPRSLPARCWLSQIGIFQYPVMTCGPRHTQLTHLSHTNLLLAGIDVHNLDLGIRPGQSDCTDAGIPISRVAVGNWRVSLKP